MRNFLKKLAVSAAVVSLALLPALGASQASNVLGVKWTVVNTEPLSASITAADTDVALVIKYNGTTTDPSVAVEADGNLTFLVGDAAYTGFECPVSGALGGIIDVSNAACDTLGEVVDIINADQSDNSGFLAVIGAGLRSYSSNDSFLADADDTDVSRPQGEVVLWDSSVLDDSGVVLVTQGLTQNQYGLDVFGTAGNQETVRLPKNPFDGTDSVLLYADERITNAGTIGDFEIHCTVEKYLQSGGSEVDTIIYRETGAATTALGQANEFLNAGGLMCRDGKLWATILASGADSSAVAMAAYGYRFHRGN
jgi:hypothetical protein